VPHGPASRCWHLDLWRWEHFVLSITQQTCSNRPRGVRQHAGRPITCTCQASAVLPASRLPSALGPLQPHVTSVLAQLLPPSEHTGSTLRLRWPTGSADCCRALWEIELSFHVPTSGGSLQVSPPLAPSAPGRSCSIVCSGAPRDMPSGLPACRAACNAGEGWGGRGEHMESGD